MPDPIQMILAISASFAVAAVFLGVYTGWGRRAAEPVWIEAGWVVGLGAGFYLGCWVLGIRPHWPPREDMDRLLVIVVPAALAMELLAAVARPPRWLTWSSRLAVAGALAPVLLHGSIYLSDAAGPGTREWPFPRAVLVLLSLAAAQATLWAALVHLARRSPGVSLTVSLAMAIGGSALAIMLSAYATGGQAGVPMAAALLGASAAAMALPSATRGHLAAPTGVAIVELASLLIIGRFFGELRTDHALVLFVAPSLAWLPELPRLRRMPPWARGLTRVVLVSAVVSVVVADAARRFVAAAGPSAPGSNGPSGQDYASLGRD